MANTIWQVFYQFFFFCNLFHEPLGELEDPLSLIFFWCLLFYLCYNFFSIAIKIYGSRVTFHWWFFCKYILFTSNICRLSWWKFIYFCTYNNFNCILQFCFILDEIKLACWNKIIIKLADIMFSYSWIWWNIWKVDLRTVLFTELALYVYWLNKDDL